MRLAFLGLVLLGSFCPGALLAQDKPGKKVAFLVGINQYQKPRFSRLQFAERDVEEMGKELKTLGFDVTVLTGEKATKKTIDEKVNTLVQPLGSSDLMLVMLAGHGIQQDVALPDGGRKNDAFYCPFDAVVGSPDTLLSLSYVIDNVPAPNVGRKLLLVDACRDEPNDPGRGSRGIEGKVIALPEDTAVMFSCRKGQQSFESSELKHGVFTYCLLEGLRGQAARDGEVLWSDITSYVDRRMGSRDFAKYLPEGRRQEPIPAGGVPYTVLGQVAAVIGPTPMKPMMEIARKDTTKDNRPAKPRPQSQSAIPKTQTSKSTHMEFVLIPAGEFLMGTSDAEVKAALLALNAPPNEEYFAREQPQHRVQMSEPFYLGKYEVSQEEYQQVTSRNPSFWSPNGKGKDLLINGWAIQAPVESVSWFDALEFCNALSERDGLPAYYKLETPDIDHGSQSIKKAKVSVLGGRGYRLPTEAEWEFACRAGTTTAYNWGNEVEEGQANIESRTLYSIVVNDQGYPANDFGLFHMHGNISEWCWDSYVESAYRGRGSLTEDPVVNAPSDKRVHRGGAYAKFERSARSADRDAALPGASLPQVGFRVARDL